MDDVKGSIKYNDSLYVRQKFNATKKYTRTEMRIFFNQKTLFDRLTLQTLF